MLRRLLIALPLSGVAWARRPSVEHELSDVQDRLVAILADLARGSDCTTIGDRIESVRRDIEGIRQRRGWIFWR